jgi:N-acetylmuramoyl-L-alanine amidase
VCAPAPRARAFQLVSRTAWGAEPLKGNHDPMGVIQRITLHHTDEHAGMQGRADLEVVHAIQAYHRDTLGWADIGYHYLVGRDGRIYEGRALTAQGAHSGGANNKNNLGISVIGNFSASLPPPAQLAALGDFLADRRAAYGVSAAALLGHRDFGPTECPGNALYGWLQDQKRLRA